MHTHMTTIPMRRPRPAAKRKQKPSRMSSVAEYKLLKSTVAINIAMLSALATKPNILPEIFKL